jgi:hypothetical protein
MTDDGASSFWMPDRTQNFVTTKMKKMTMTLRRAKT